MPICLLTSLCLLQIWPPSHQLARGAVESQPGHGRAPRVPDCAWLQALGDRVLRRMLGLTTVANSQAGPCRVCQREGMQGSEHPGWLS